MELFEKIRQRFLCDQFGRSVAKLAGGAAFGQALTLSVSPVLSRLYTPDDFGMLGVFSSIASIVTLYAAMSYEQAIPLADTDDEAGNIAVLSCCVLLLLCGAAFCFLSYKDWRDEVLINGLPPAILLLLPLCVCAGGMYRIMINLTVRAKNYGPIATTSLYQAILQVVVQLGVGLWRPNPLGLIAGFIVSQGGGTFSLFAKNRQKSALCRGVSLASMLAAARKYREFPLFMSWAALLNSASMHLPGVLIAKYYGIGAAGFYYLSRRALGAPMILLRTSVSQVFMGEASSLYRENPAELKSLFYATSRKLLQIGCFVCIPAAILSPYLFPLVFGPNWEMAGRITQVLALFQLCQFSVGPLMQVLLILGKRKILLLVDTIRFSLIILSFYVTSLMGRGFMHAVIVYVCAASLYYVVNYLYIFFLVSRIDCDGDNAEPVQA